MHMSTPRRRESRECGCDVWHCVICSSVHVHCVCTVKDAGHAVHCEKAPTSTEKDCSCLNECISVFMNCSSKPTISFLKC